MVIKQALALVKGNKLIYLLLWKKVKLCSFANSRELIPKNPEEEGFEVKTMEMTPNDMLIHNGYTWHYSAPNTREGYNRRGLSIRIIRGDVVFNPRPGQGAAFLKQIDVKPGEKLEGKSFPEL